MTARIKITKKDVRERFKTNIVIARNEAWTEKDLEYSGRRSIDLGHGRLSDRIVGWIEENILIYIVRG